MSDFSESLKSRSDRLNAADVFAAPVIAKITRVDYVKGREIPMRIFYEGDDGKPFEPCKNMMRVLAGAWGTKESEDLVGGILRLENDPSVTYGDKKTGGVRITHMSRITSPKTFHLMIRRGQYQDFTVSPLQVETASLTIDDARQAIADAQSIDALQNVWRAKTMAPFRAELEPVLAERKLALSQESSEASPPDAAAQGSQQSAEQEAAGEPDYQAMVEDWKDRLSRAEIIGDILIVSDEIFQTKEALPVDVQADLKSAVDLARARFDPTPHEG